ncbi:MAG: mycothiol system anti-sigma-R factor [Acidimicrobiales bacterium]|jgi:mycothiol system anti-sigma-R factor
MGDHDQAEFDCREALHRIYHFLDGELTPVRRHEIESHLDGCSPCLQMFGFEAELRRVVHDKCRDAVPDTLRQRIADSINHEHLAGNHEHPTGEREGVSGS